MGGEMRCTRSFAAGSFCFRVFSDDPDFLEIVESLYRDLQPGVESIEEFSVIAAPTGGMVLDGPQLENFMLPLAPQVALNQLIWAVNRSSLDAESHLLHFHAGGVSIDGRGFVLVAPSGTGKSTLVTNALNDGVGYLSDEAVGVARDSDLVFGHPKPLTLKPTGHHLVSDLLPHAITARRRDADVWHVPASVTGASPITEMMPTDIVRLEPATAGGPTVRPMTLATAAFELIENCQDFDRFGPDAMLQTANLAARCACHRLDLGTPGASVRALKSSPRRNASAVVVEPIGHCNPAVPDATIAVRIGSEGLIHNIESGALATLDNEALTAWLNFATGTGPVSDLHQGFAAQLERARFIEPLGGRSESS